MYQSNCCIPPTPHLSTVLSPKQYSRINWPENDQALTPTNQSLTGENNKAMTNNAIPPKDLLTPQF